jgi:hypothetical protein
MTDAVRNRSSECKVRLRGLDKLLVRVAKSAVLGSPQVEHLFKRGGLCNASPDFNRRRYGNEARNHQIEYPV